MIDRADNGAYRSTLSKIKKYIRTMKALFITIADLKAKSIIDGNTDADKLIHQIEVAQDMHIQNYLRR